MLRAHGERWGLGRKMTQSGSQEKNHVLRSLRAGAQDFIARRSSVRAFESGEMVVDAGSQLTHVIFPLCGRLSLMAVTGDGQQIEAGSVGCEGLLGFSPIFTRDAATTRAVGRIGGMASWLPMADMHEALEEFQCVAPAMLRYAAGFADRALRLSACNALHSVEQRLARWLIDAGRAQPLGGPIGLPETDFAAILGTTTDAIAAAGAHLAAQRAVVQRRGEIVTADHDALDKASCGCQSVDAAAS
jgi:CRP-like cAMP-binding protein